MLAVQHEEFGRARFGTDAHILVFVVVVVEHVLPFVHAVAPILVERAQLVRLIEIHKLHTAEQGIAHQHGKTTTVLDHRAFCAGRGQGCRSLGLVSRVAGILPFVHQRGIDGAYEHAQPRNNVFELFIALFGRHGARQCAVSVRQVPQQRALGTGDVVAGDVSGEVGGGFHHVAHHGFWRQPVVVRPRHIMAILIECGLEHVFQRLGIGDLLQLVHALVVVESIGLHVGHGLVSRLTLLRTQHLLGVFQRGLGHRDDVQRVGVRFRIEQLQCGQQERAQGLVEREVIRHIEGHVIVFAAIRTIFGLNDLGIEQSAEDFIGPLVQMFFLIRGLR